MASISTQNALRSAAQYQQAGNLAEAQRICQDALRLEPASAPLLHLLGVLAYQSGDVFGSAAWIARAIAADASVPDYHLHLGNVLQDLAKFNEAAETYER